MTMRTFVSAALAASALTFAAAPASAQQIDRVISFGDSYADTGIAYQAILADPGASAATKAQLQQVYPTGRFSGGSNYIDTLGTILNAPVVNFAVGGAVAGTFPVPFGSGSANNVNCGPGGSLGGVPTLCPMGFTYEVNQYLDVGTQNPLFPSVAPTFGPGDLVAVSIGGNDARYYQQNYSTMPMSAFVNGSIVGAKGGLDRLVAAGAPTISFLAGDTGRLPEVIGNTAAATIRSSYSTQFNTGMQGVLAGYAASGVMVHYLDLNLVLDNILANPTAYGITKGSAATGYTCPTPTATDPGCLVNSTGYLFYVDGLHLTSTGFQIVARYVAAQLDAPLTIGAPSVITLDNARQFGRSMTQRLDSTAPRDGDMPEGMRFNIEGDGYHVRNDANASSNGFRSSGIGVMGTVEYGFGSGLAGLAVRAARPKAHFYGDDASADAKSLEVGVYGAVGLYGGFVQGYAGLGRDRLDLDRPGVVMDLGASPKGHHALAGMKGGYLLPVAGLRVGPVVGLDWAHSYVKAYAEDGDPALNLGVGSVKMKSLRGSLGLEARGDLDLNGTSFRPYAGAVLEKQFANNDRVVRFNQQSAPTIVNSWDVMGESKDLYGRLTGGIAAEVTRGLRVDASIQGTIGRDGGNETAGNLAARIAF